MNKASIFSGKTICVFGGTGTIGSLIVEYLLKKNPYSIRIFSNDENSLWKKEQKWNSDILRFLLGDIRDYNRVLRATRNVDYVFNCAAIKHVPKAEYNPIEAVKTNILGLDNIIEACINAKVKKLLHISTDKACEPICIMGYTKAIGEKLMQIRWAQNPKFDMVSVRLGNVYGSRGSIIPIVKKLIKQNKPIMITDPNMKRYFMKKHEVINFIMKAFREGNHADIWIPKLKEELLIDILEKEFKISEKDIIFIGKRKSEKLKEILISQDELKDALSEEKYWILKNTYPRSF